ncbi:MAG: sugar phosphate isomerase/epimerase [Pseudomonadota bacterium]
MWQNGSLSLAYLTVDGASAAGHARAAAAAGFDAAGLRLCPPSHLKQAALFDDPAALGEVAAIVRDNGLQLLDAEVATIAEPMPTGRLHALIDTAADLGFRYVQTVVEDDDAGRAADRFAAFAERANDRGIGVALEFMAFRPLNSLAAAVAMLEHAGARDAGLVIDALHFFRAGETAASLSGLSASVPALVQLCDAPASSPGHDALADEARGGRLMPGAGGLDLAGLFRALPAALPVSVEVPAAAAASDPPAERAEKAYAAASGWLAGFRRPAS